MAITVCRIGRLAAITMITKTNIGSVKLRAPQVVDRRILAESQNRVAISTKAQKPKTTSTSASKCHNPAWRGWTWARWAKTGREGVRDGDAKDDGSDDFRG